MRKFSSHGDGRFQPKQLASLGQNVIFEEDVRVWHPETVSIGNNVYIGHRAMLKGYHSGRLEIGNDTWIGQDIFFHAAGNIRIGNQVGIGPRVSILTSYHQESGRGIPILEAPLKFEPVVIEDDCDIGLGAILLPGVTIGKGAQVGAGAVVTKSVKPYEIVVGNPAHTLKMRP